MNNVLPDKEAKILCNDLIKNFDHDSNMQFLMNKNCGKQFGILITKDGTVYKAYSGAYSGLFNNSDFVEPIYDIKEFKLIESHYDPLIKSDSNPETRKIKSNECLKEIINLYQVHCFDEKIRKITEIFPNAPTGTGDCCAIKLLNKCYKDKKEPVSLAEFFYGDGSFEHKSFQYPCEARCKPLLKYILGLDILYQDDAIVVVNKPSGLLSIEGKGIDKQDCISARVRKLFNTIPQPCIHRLDQATNGIMVLGKTQEAHDILSKDFENRNIYKEYEATVHGEVTEYKGTITLKQRLDVDNRPLQIIDEENGKTAITEWVKIKYDNKTDTTKLRLIPHTGRTHQLRLFCKTINHPIVNDTLYGIENECGDLMLKAKILEFTHPVTKEKMSFSI